jgi:hypothetical protein
VGLVLQLAIDAVEGQDLQEMHVKGSEVAGYLVVECHGGSITATLPIAVTDYRLQITVTLDDKMVPAILAARTEIANFFFHFCSR